MSLDTALRRAAQQVVRATGMPTVLRRITVGAYNAATGTGTDTSEDQTVTARLDEYTLRELGGTVQLGDRKLMVAALDLDWVPVEHDRVVIDAKEWDVVTVRQDTAATLPAFYTLQLRR